MNLFHKILVVFTLFILISCQQEKQMQWCQTEDGIYVWISPPDDGVSLKWDGPSLSGVANGKGLLTYKGNSQIQFVEQCVMEFGTIEGDGVRQINDSQKFIGGIEDGHLSGFCVFINGNDTYIGNFTNSLPNGKADLYRDGKLYYSGQWANGEIDGKGCLYRQDGTRLSGEWSNGQVVETSITANIDCGTYSGTIKNGQPSGYGTLHYNNGEWYSGNWENGIYNGAGEYNSPSFSYSGNWKNGIPEGLGYITFSDGTSYYGDLVEGVRRGIGNATFFNGESYSGNWENDAFNGNGTYFYENGSQYSGNWRDGLQDGFGTYETTDFDYHGNWEEGWINGEGIIEYSNGDRYEGSFVENQRYGVGRYEFADGSFYEGEFIDDVFNGLGIYSFPDGSYYEGEFLDGHIKGDGTYYYSIEDETVAITANWDGTNNFPRYASILFSNGDIYEGEIINGGPTNNGSWYTSGDESKTKEVIKAANDYYQLHKQTFDKVVLITSASLALVALTATTISTAGATTPALVAAANTMASIATVANTTNTVINAIDIAANVSSAAIDDDWDGVAKEVAINAAFIIVPKAVSKAITSSPARKVAVKLSESAILKVARKPLVSISKSTPFKKIVTLVRDESGKWSKKLTSANKHALQKFNDSKAGRRLIKRHLAKQVVKAQKNVIKYAAEVGLNPKLQNRLFDEISVNQELALLINDNPEFNIARWITTQRKVDKSLLSKIARNTQYAGKNFYFHPALNKNIDNYLKQTGKFSGYSREQLLELDRLFPNGVPYSKSGFPDFVKAGCCKKDAKGNVIRIIMPDGHFTMDRQKDFAIAREEFLKQYGFSAEEYGYIWHHLEGDPAAMVLVRTDAHEICRHSGGHALEKLRQQSK